MDSKIKKILYEYAKDINLLMKHEHKKDEICDYMFEILQKVNFIKNNTYINLIYFNNLIFIFIFLCYYKL